MKRALAILISFLFFQSQIKAQVGINSDNSAPHPSAQLDIKSTDKGLLIPRLNTLERNAIQNPEIGLMVFDKDFQEIFVYNSDGWKQGTMSKLPLDIIVNNSFNVLRITNNTLGISPSGYNTSAEFIHNTDFGIALYAKSTKNNYSIIARNTANGTAIVGDSEDGLGGIFQSKNNVGLTASSQNSYSFNAFNNNEFTPTVLITNKKYNLNNNSIALEMQGNLQINGRVILESYQYPTLVNSWINEGEEWNLGKFYKDKQGIVHLEGVLSYGTSNLIFNLPIGYRPSKRCIFTISTASGIGRVDIFPNGNVELMSGQHLLLSLDGISFRVD